MHETIVFRDIDGTLNLFWTNFVDGSGYSTIMDERNLSFLVYSVC